MSKCVKEISDEVVTVPVYLKNILNAEFPTDSDEDDVNDSDYDHDGNSVNNEDCSSLSQNSDNELEAAAVIDQLENNNTELELLYSHDNVAGSVALARERKVKDVRPTKSHASSTLDKNASKWINIRIREYPNNFFSEVANQLYCNCCTKFISLKKDIINKHVDGPRHQSYQVQHKKRCNMQQNLHKYVQNHLQIIDETKAKLMVYRLEVCRVFLIDGLPFHLLEDGKKCSRLRELLERDRVSVGRREVSQLIPTVLKMEMDSVLTECKGKNISFSFDGTTDVAEVMNIVIRYVTDNSKITQRLVALKLLSKSPDHHELARFLHSTLLLDNKIECDNIHAAVRDGAAVNGAALNLLTSFLPRCVFPICLSHSINVAGAEIKKSADIARMFISLWALVIGHSNVARMKFKTLSGVSAQRIGKVRWFTFWEVGAQCNDFYSCVKEVIYDDADFAEESRIAVRSCLTKPNAERDLLLELALIKDCEFMVKFCYFQEGDSFLSPTTFDHWNEVIAKLRYITKSTTVNNFKEILPNVYRVMTQLQVEGNCDDAMRVLLLAQTVLKAKPMYQKLKSDSANRLAHTLSVMRACRIFNYLFIAKTAPDSIPEELEHLQLLAGIDQRIRDKIKDEFSLYTAKSVYEAAQQQPLQLWAFFVKYRFVLPNIYIGACEAALITPSSATSERVFARYTSCFDKEMGSALEDRRAASVILHMNERFRHLESL